MMPNDDGWLFNIAEIVSLGNESQAPARFWEMLGLSHRESRADLAAVGDGLFRARLETLDRKLSGDLLEAGKLISSTLGGAKRCFRANVLTKSDSLHLLIVRSQDGQNLVLTMGLLDWTVARTGDSDLLHLVESRVLQSERGFVFEEYGEEGFERGLAWDGREAVAETDSGVWSQEAQPPSSLPAKISRFLGEG